jgi:hypothetical protein
MTTANIVDEEGTSPSIDLLVGGRAIKKFIVSLGMPKGSDPYYLKKRGWPIGRLHGDDGQLVSTKTGIVRHIQKNAAGKSTA